MGKAMETNPLNIFGYKIYNNALERGAAFEKLMVEILELKDSNGLVRRYPQVHELMDIYTQAEKTLYECQEALKKGDYQ